MPNDNDELLKSAKKRAMNILQRTDVTEERLKRKLKDKDFPDDVISDVIDYVKSYGYIDDRRYAENYIRAKSETYSRQVIKSKLLERGIDKDIIEHELTQFYENDELNANVEEELIKKLIHKKCKNPEELDFEGRQKLLAYLVRKGFSYSQADKFLT